MKCVILLQLVLVVKKINSIQSENFTFDQNETRGNVPVLLKEYVPPEDLVPVTQFPHKSNSTEVQIPKPLWTLFKDQFWRYIHGKSNRAVESKFKSNYSGKKL